MMWVVAGLGVQGEGLGTSAGPVGFQPEAAPPPPQARGPRGRPARPHQCLRASKATYPKTIRKNVNVRMLHVRKVAHGSYSLVGLMFNSNYLE